MLFILISTNKFCGKNAELQNAKASGACSDRCGLKYEHVLRFMLF
jgi:hypothetical protein